MSRIRRSTGSFLPLALALGLAACGGQPEAASPAQPRGALTASGVTVDVVAAQSWPGGFNGAVRITNTGLAAPITSFEIVFRLAGNAGVGNAWNGAISAPDASGNRTATHPAWLQYAPVGTGQTWDVGFSGTGTFSGATIVSIKVNGRSVTDPVDAPPTVSLAASASTVTPPACVTLTATAADDVGVSRVEFHEGTTLLGTDATAPYSLQVCPTGAGIHTYTARAVDTAAQATTSAAATVEVPTIGPDPLTLRAEPSVVTEPGCVTLTPVGGPADAVRADFYDGDTRIGTDTTAPFAWQACFTRADNGAHAFRAALYQEDMIFTSPAVSVLVDIPAENTPPTCALAASATTVRPPATVTFTATATDDVGVVKVEFYEGATLLASDTAAPYTLAQSFTTANNGAHVFTCRAYDAAGYTTTSAPVTVVVNVGTAADVTLTVDTSAGRKTISPYVYGYNAGKLAEAPPGATFLRIGGNRWTAYNWTNNWSNAGQDWGPFSNDTHLGTASQGPGAAITPTLDDARANGVGALVTIPMQGWVSQAKSGNVSLADPVASWFVPNLPAKGSAFTLTPSPTSAAVYQDELANFVASRWGAAPHLSLDNEPDLWGYVDSSGKGTGTHPEIQRTQLTYAAFLEKSVASATAIKAAVPSALVYGPVSYGWNGMVNFQNAPDAGSASIDDSFLDRYLTAMAAASTSGNRLLDVLDVHWYSEAQSNGCTPSGVRVTNADNSDCVVAARVQAPRSLFDRAFVETSWITQWTTESSAMGKAIQLVPRLQAKIASKFPGTRLALTEYNHGGEDHVSGAVAQADTLGILGREGVYSAAFWSISSTGRAWSNAAWKAYRDYDGSGHHFGDTSVAASTTDLDHVSVYASVDSTSPDRLVLVVVHRPTLDAAGALDLKARTVQVQWSHAKALRTARAWQLAGGTSPAWKAVSVAAPTEDAVTLTLPALSVTTLELTP